MTSTFSSSNIIRDVITKNERAISKYYLPSLIFVNSASSSSKFVCDVVFPIYSSDNIIRNVNKNMTKSLLMKYL